MGLLLFPVAILIMATEGQYETKSGIQMTDQHSQSVRNANYYSLVGQKRQIVGNTNSFLDATDYLEVKRQLDRASRKSFGQRLAEWFRRGEDTIPPTAKPRLNLKVGVRYRVEVGVMPTVTFNLNHKKYSAMMAIAASFNGSYGVSLYGRKSVSAERAIVDCRVDAGRLTVRFWGLGYNAAIDNQHTTYDRLACNLKVGYRYRLIDNLWLGLQLTFRNWEAQSMSQEGMLYIERANESFTSIQCGSVVLVAEYDSRRYECDILTGGYARVEQEIIPKIVSSGHNTLWHTSIIADYYQKAWSGAVIVFSMSGEFWSLSAPWLLWPSVGSSERMRGYRYGRYLARNMLSMQIVLRQRIYAPIWTEIWGGAAQMYSSGKSFCWRHTLPAYGVGLRLELPRRIAISVGYGFGHRADGLMVNISEKF